VISEWGAIEADKLMELIGVDGKISKKDYARWWRCDQEDQVNEQIGVNGKFYKNYYHEDEGRPTLIYETLTEFILTAHCRNLQKGWLRQAWWSFNKIDPLSDARVDTLYDKLVAEGKGHPKFLNSNIVLPLEDRRKHVEYALFTHQDTLNDPEFNLFITRDQLALSLKQPGPLFTNGVPSLYFPDKGGFEKSLDEFVLPVHVRLTLSNKTEVPRAFRIIHPSTSQFRVTPREGVIKVGESCTVGVVGYVGANTDEYSSPYDNIEETVLGEWGMHSLLVQSAEYSPDAHVELDPDCYLGDTASSLSGLKQFAWIEWERAVGRDDIKLDRTTEVHCHTFNAGYELQEAAEVWGVDLAEFNMKVLVREQEIEMVRLYHMQARKRAAAAAAIDPVNHLFGHLAPGEHGELIEREDALKIKFWMVTFFCVPLLAPISTHVVPALVIYPWCLFGFIVVLVVVLGFISFCMMFGSVIMQYTCCACEECKCIFEQGWIEICCGEGVGTDFNRSWGDGSMDRVRHLAVLILPPGVFLIITFITQSYVSYAIQIYGRPHLGDNYFTIVRDEFDSRSTSAYVECVLEGAPTTVFDTVRAFF